MPRSERTTKRHAGPQARVPLTGEHCAQVGVRGGVDDRWDWPEELRKTLI